LKQKEPKNSRLTVKILKFKDSFH